METIWFSHALQFIKSSKQSSEKVKGTERIHKIGKERYSKGRQ